MVGADNLFRESMKEWCKILLRTGAFVMALISVIPILGQDRAINVDNISLASGLSQLTIIGIHKDSRGYMWFGTFDGLNKFDGYTMTVYRNNPLDSTSISNNRVRAIYEDDMGELWFGSANGINKYNREKDNFKYYPLNRGGDEKLSIVGGFHVDDQGILYVATFHQGIFRYEPTQDEFVPVDLEYNGQLINRIQTTMTDNNGKWWLATADFGVFSIDLRKQLIENFRHIPGEINSLSSNRVDQIMQTSDSVLWITTESGLDRLNVDDGSIERIPSVRFDVRSLGHVDKETIWVGSRTKGLLALNTTSGLVERLELLPAPKQDNISIELIYVDNTSTVWLGTFGNGVFKYNSAIDQFGFMNVASDGPLPLSFGFEVVGNELWIATFGGLYKMNLLEKEPKIEKIETHLRDNRILALLYDEANGIWVGTYNGLHLLDSEANLLKSFLADPGDPFSLSYKVVLSLHKDQEGALWIGTFNGLDKLDELTETFTHFVHDPNDPNSIVANSIMKIVGDQNGNLYIGTGAGLDKLNLLGTKFEHLTKGYISSLKLRSNNQLWAGTYDEGLKLIDLDRGNVIDSLNKMLDEYSVNGIVEDTHENVWFSTSEGISVFNPTTGSLTDYNKEDGVYQDEFNGGSYFQLSDGRIVFGGNNGINLLHPDSIVSDPNAPIVEITKFKIFNEDVPIQDEHDKGAILTQNITETESIDLTYQHSVISFEFAALHFAAPMRNQFAYMMEGFDQNWTYTTASRRYVTYTNLDPGTYTFRVKASNKDGVWTEESKTIKLFIAPPPWKTWWAYTLYFIVITGSIVGFYYWRTFTLRERKRELEIEVDNRTRELVQTQSQLIQSEKMASLGQLTAGIAHEINNPVSFTSVSSIGLGQDLADVIGLIDKYQEYIRNGKNSPEKILEYEKSIDYEFLKHAITQGIADIQEGTKRTTEIVKGLREFSHEDHVEMEPADIHVGIDSTLNILNSRLKQGVSMTKNYDRSIGMVTCHIGQLNQVFMNLITNAIDAMNGKGTLTITTKNLSNTVSILFSDTGSGIKKENIDKIFDPFFTTKEVGSGTGLGLSISHGIIEKHGGKIEVRSEVGQGSEFVINLPLSN